MPDASEDISYRGFKLSTVRQGGEWLATIWPTQVEQALPNADDAPVMGNTREAALDAAKREVDRLLGSDS